MVPRSFKAMLCVAERYSTLVEKKAVKPRRKLQN